MITTERQLIDLLNETYDNPIIEKNRFGKIVIKGKGVYCEFYFTDITEKDYNAAEQFLGHRCLSFGFQYQRKDYYGGGYMSVADKTDLSNEIINFIDKYLSLKKKRYEQLSLFDF